ncbi:sulfotransferase family 2 domain-containing protein [Sagittula sp. S175]|uniref:sulfotransferase family 2 domain-containing protein n=1 Tax=Sagittula sp. S175 TaxID=3415129 RepID=UPI003C7EABB4
MPTFLANGGLHCFAHVPKCAGTTVEHHLAQRFGPLGMMGNHPLVPVSLQHLTWADLEAFCVPGQILSSFALVRHPLTRFVSTYNMRVAQVSPPFPRDVTLEDFADWVAARLPVSAMLLDNHLRPQVDFLGPDTRLFRLEDGLDPVIAWLDAQFGPCEAAAPLGHERHRPDETAALFDTVSEVPPRVLETVGRLYAADFERLGYDMATAPVQKVLRLKPGQARPVERTLWRLRAALVSAIRSRRHGRA